MKQSVFLLLVFFALQLKAQPSNCVLKQPVITIDFGSGYISDVNIVTPANYERVRKYCPNDGHYAYTPYTSDCFDAHWFTLDEDHTPGDVSGNMLLVNSSYDAGTFLKTTLNGLKAGATYEFAAWLMNVCKISSHCPFLLLPNLTILLQTGSGKTVARINTGEIVRRDIPHWTRHRAFFTVPLTETTLTLTMLNNNSGGCGNDFAIDDISFRECVPLPPPVTTKPKTTAIPTKQAITVKPVPKKTTAVPVKKIPSTVPIVKPEKDSGVSSTPILKRKPQNFPPPPPVLTSRVNTLVKQIETGAGEIRIDLYDNGEIDGDTVSIYHNNTLLMAHARLSQKPLSVRIAVDADHPHHELVMVAENLGSIPPNTSLMIITAGTKRYEAFISSTEQKNSKVVIDLKE